MEGIEKIREFREKMDRTLASRDLVNKDSIKKLVKERLLSSSESETEGINEVVIERRTMQVKNFLDLMRSASGNQHGKASKANGATRSDWKLKDDNEAYRVMYREGPEGTPFHTLLIEGYADSPADVCLSAAWEVALYTKWFPHLNVPTFKIIANHRLEDVRFGEHISIVRMKLLWPLSARELVLHYFELDFFEEGLVIALINTIPDVENVSKQTHGFSRERVPEATDTVRMELIGGTAMKKLSPNKTYFRTIGTMDMKLNFVPSTLINFIARQLMGGACKLYQKVVPMAESDEDFQRAVKDPFYARLREGLYSEDKLKKEEQDKSIESEKSRASLPERYEIGSQNSFTLHKYTTSRPEILSIIDNKSLTYKIKEGDVAMEDGDTKEEELHDEQKQKEDEQEEYHDEQKHKHEDEEQREEEEEESSHQVEEETKHGYISSKINIVIREEVQGALEILENVMDMVHRGELGNKPCFGFEPIKENVEDLEAIISEVESNSSNEEGLVHKCEPIDDKVQTLAPVIMEQVETSSSKEEGLVHMFEPIDDKTQVSEPIIVEEGPLHSDVLDDANAIVNEDHNKSDTLSCRPAKSVLSLREVHRNRIAPASSPFQDSVSLTEDHQRVSSCSTNYVSSDLNMTAGMVSEGENKSKPKKKWRFSCFHFISSLI